MIEDAHREVGKYMCSRYGCSLVSAVLTEMGGMCIEHSRPLLFLIQRIPWRSVAGLGCVPWEFIKPHEQQALRNHGGQTLARLSERGGLSANEAIAVIQGRYAAMVDRDRPQHDANVLLQSLLDAWRAHGIEPGGERGR